MVWAIEFDKDPVVIEGDGTAVVTMTNHNSFTAHLELLAGASTSLSELEAPSDKRQERIFLKVPQSATARCRGKIFCVRSHVFTLLQSHWRLASTRTSSTFRRTYASRAAVTQARPTEYVFRPRFSRLLPFPAFVLALSPVGGSQSRVAARLAEKLIIRVCMN